jgi:signal transduction histidine kinase
MVVRVYGEKVNGLAVITVEDNGPGIEPEHLDKILLPFYTTRGRGFGLGLYIVNSVMKAHNGRIEIISTVGEGSKFKMVFGNSL